MCTFYSEFSTGFKIATFDSVISLIVCGCISQCERVSEILRGDLNVLVSTDVLAVFRPGGWLVWLT